MTVVENLARTDSEQLHIMIVTAQKIKSDFIPFRGGLERKIEGKESRQEPGTMRRLATGLKPSVQIGLFCEIFTAFIFPGKSLSTKQENCSGEKNNYSLHKNVSTCIYKNFI